MDDKNHEFPPEPGASSEQAAGRPRRRSRRNDSSLYSEHRGNHQHDENDCDIDSEEGVNEILVADRRLADPSVALPGALSPADLAALRSMEARRPNSFVSQAEARPCDNKHHLDGGDQKARQGGTPPGKS